MEQKNKKSEAEALSFFDKLSGKITGAVGSAAAFYAAAAVVIVWLATGPLFDFSETWQLIINTGTTIVTFLMVFIIQQSQNKDTVAIHLKLNELIACNEKANNKLVDVEDLSDQELRVLKQFYVELARVSKRNNDLHSTHSLDEAQENEQEKQLFHKNKKTRS
ncbi:MAG: low affinity iron permease family protein [Bacteroidota bacterium]